MALPRPSIYLFGMLRRLPYGFINIIAYIYISVVVTYFEEETKYLVLFFKKKNQSISNMHFK